MIDITTPLTSVCMIVLFGTILVSRQPGRLHQLIGLGAFGAMLFLVVSKYFFGHPVMAPIGRAAAIWLGIGTTIAAVTVCVLVVRKARHQERARQAGEQ